MDIVSKETRSRMMSAVKSKNTRLETAPGKRLYAMGLRYRLHDRKLPGRPDFSFPKFRSVIFVNGCFWHLHECEFSSIPETGKQWWKNKLEENRKRDIRNQKILMKNDWRIAILWECAIRKAVKAGRTAKLEEIAALLNKFLISGYSRVEIDRDGMTALSGNQERHRQ